MLTKDNDEYKVVQIVSMLVDEGRKRGVHGTIGILNTEAIEFAQDLQERTAARLANRGVGMNPNDMLPIVNEELEAAIDRFWSQPHSFAK
ncbi:MAG TPA: hypothetical protein VNV41_02670 [Candidatus Acidoferrales bacterium]|jgi:hypothetical protein|nr:hypothetical protein [Candidatus Acidoferrales bacterium]